MKMALLRLLLLGAMLIGVSLNSLPIVIMCLILSGISLAWELARLFSKLLDS